MPKRKRYIKNKRKQYTTKKRSRLGIWRFFKGVFNNFFALVLGITGFVAFAYAIASFFITGLTVYISPWAWFAIFSVASLICFAIARIIVKRS